ncbi:MAG: Dot/Icm type IV secretion system ATPase DotB [Pseudomonadota bacterium]|nr:Dot/Icm type IV secretion system ATPase DotB [Gammaproteobacteria bacterium]MBU1558373.1 Dot/Icm type IV secretion system ATPase DotB [Gammaproteobacteria bacterium]MBU1926808.1 Dot/Icm type IV secretion system ATPase DotB [Gammaproteobacteria bacterium]MBU2546411.1 Dot/Icm type IV secretion system ATPase DotB [Gammaproteobacteria bacterium]
MTNEEQCLFQNEPARFTIDSIDELLIFAAKANASDITIQTEEQIFAEIYGRLHKITKRRISNNEVGEIINEIYGSNATAQLLGGHDIDTHYEVRPTRSERFRFRINATSCLVEGHDAIQITARIIPNEPPDLSSLDLPQAILDAYDPSQGIVYITGATGSGKSTLLAAIIKDIVSKENGNRKVLTYEAPIEFVFDSVPKPSSIVSQMEIPRHLPSFAAGVRNALRRKPGLILVGESRDKETINASIEAALTGHPVYTTLHSTGVAETIRRLVTSFPFEERHGRSIDILETIRLVVWQKLVPTIDGKRVALREFLVFDESIRDKLLSSDLENATKNTRKLLRQYGQVMDVDAKEKFDKGIIDERTYQLVCATTHNADIDAGILK